MTQADPASYRRLSPSAVYEDGDGLFREVTTGDVVLMKDAAVLQRYSSRNGDSDEAPSSLRCHEFEDFNGRSLNVTDDKWVATVTAAAGSPVTAIHADAADGQFAIACDAQSEVQNLCLSWNDELNIDVDKNPAIVFRLAVNATLAAADSMVFGLAGARNDTLDSVAQHAWFKIIGANLTLLLETDDGTTDTDDKDPSLTLTAATMYEFKIDLADSSDVRFYYRATLGGAWTALTVASTTFDVSAYTGGVQPYFQVQKTTGTTTPGIKIDYVKLVWDRS